LGVLKRETQEEGKGRDGITIPVLQLKKVTMMMIAKYIQTYKHAYRHAISAYKHTYIQTDIQTDIHTYTKT
tara:strand:+ start:379 stop:591 length:213 start_codon:yes stop_codon:yes gene_type:complete